MSSFVVYFYCLIGVP